MKIKIKKVFNWMSNKWRWVAGATIGGLMLIAYAFGKRGPVKPEIPPHENALPPPPDPVPPIFREEARAAATQAEAAIEAPQTMDAADVAAGLARHAKQL